MTISLGTFVSPVLSAMRLALSAWGTLRRTVRLRLDLPHDRDDPSKRGLTIVQHGDRWQVVYGLTLHNGGSQPAQNWRLRLAALDPDTMLWIDPQPNSPAVDRARYFKNRWQYEIAATSPAHSVPLGLPLHVVNMQVISFRAQPAFVDVRCLLTADGMKHFEGVLRLELQWHNRTARFRWRDEQR